MSCVFCFETNQYVQFISNLQLHSIIQNEKKWNFKVDILDCTNQQILQLQQQSNKNQENLQNVIQLCEGDNQFFIYDQQIKLVQDEIVKQGNGLCIIKSSNELLKILDSASVFNKKSKKEVKGKGIEFTHTDFTIKIGEFKKNAKNVMIFYCYYKPYTILPPKELLETYYNIYAAYFSQILYFVNLTDFDKFEEQLKSYRDQLIKFYQDAEYKENEYFKDQTKKELEYKKNLAKNNVQYIGELILVHHMIGILNIN
ncbi:unnamed protein product [Paramecium pentaurelia]|uniref:Uncharacterized protein n=1 Tax=Paramecium pentaurelia TaxID=43138 RepID=A0A8S1VEN1_9CILI|nr:unnamed protein product [Paramecium pentaurelia]